MKSQPFRIFLVGLACVLFACCLCSAVALIINNTNITGGKGWTLTGLSGKTIPVLAVDPKNPSILYAGVYEGVVWKSDNGGKSWHELANGLRDIPVENCSVGEFATFCGDSTMDVETIYALAVDPNTTTTVYAGAYFGGMWKSTDGGTTWISISEGLGWGPIRTQETTVTALAMDPQTTDILYVASNAGIISKTTDGGLYWVTVLEQIPGVFVLAIDPANTSTVYAGTSIGLFKSVDGGETWMEKDEGMFFPAGRVDDSVQAFLVDPNNPDTLYAGTSSSIYLSTDGGESWTRSNQGIFNPYVYGFAVHPGHPSVLFAATADGLFQSSDAGRSWAEADDTGLTNKSIRYALIDPTSPPSVIVGTESGIYRRQISDSAGLLPLEPAPK